MLVRRHSCHQATWTPGIGAEDKLHKQHYLEASGKFQQQFGIIPSSILHAACSAWGMHSLLSSTPSHVTRKVVQNTRPPFRFLGWSENDLYT